MNPWVTSLLRGRCPSVFLVVLVGVGLSCLAARTIAHDAARQARERFSLAASQVDGALNLELQRESDLLVATGAVLRRATSQPQRAFRDWTHDVGVLRSYPELVSLATIVPAPDRRCPAVTMVEVSWTERSAALAATSICAELPTLRATAATGRLTNFGFASSPRLRLYGEALPVYRTPRARRTAAGWRGRLLGWVAVTLDPEVLLHRARVGAPGLRLTVRSTSVDHLTFANGPRVGAMRPGGSALDTVSTRTRLRNGSQVMIFGSVPTAAITADPWAMLTLVGGGSLALLIGLLVALLRGGRERALELVAEKTGELARLALHDALTGLPNRLLLMDRVEQALALSHRLCAPVGLLFIDVDGFKTVNDTFGHGAGDTVLRMIAARLTGALRECDTIGRLGGDEFVVLLELAGTTRSPTLVAQRILEALSEPFQIADETTVTVGASIGIAVVDGGSADELLRDADLALYAAKAAGKNRYAVFAPQMQTELAERTELERDLRRALADRELFLLFQPTVYLDNRRVRGVEALVRWEHPARGIIPPDLFIPIAEESGLIVELGRWVIAEACRQAVIWRQRGVQLLMAVNVSGRQLDDAGFVGEIQDILAETGMDPALLVLEVTETALIRDPAHAAALLARLRDLGARIAIDDFGTGYSSFTHLRQLPVDTIKIDRSFVTGLGGGEEADALVGALVQLGQSLRVTTLAEGIEDERQRAHLRDLGCELGQGFLFGRPMSAGQFEDLLERGALVVDERGRAAVHRRRSGTAEPADAPQPPARPVTVTV